MYYKVSPVLIAILIAIIVVVVGLGIFLFKGDFKGNSGKSEVISEEIVPNLDLSLNTEEPDQEYVIIKSIASTEDQNGIASVTLPDGSIVKEDEAEYKVTENGNYKFKVKGNNGKTSSKTIEISNIKNASATSPYIPEGFSHKEGEVEDGFVIEDQYENEFVWVPIENGKITRNTMLDTDYEESNSTATALVNSVAKNYGFYIGRYEASSVNVDGKTVAMSKAGCMPWTNVSFVEASEASNESARAFAHEDCQTAILNSYAWDATLAWIDEKVESYSSNTSYGNYSGEIKKTGETESDKKNNIFDLAGNVREWTTEIYKNKETKSTKKDKNDKNNKNKKNKNVVNELDEVVSETVNYRVIRGGSANLSRTASSHTGYKENMSDNYWGFRLVLYK